jgi:hypothetical protein
MRTVLLAVTLVLIFLIAFVMVYETARTGLKPLVIPTLFVLALFCFGIVGALRHPPGE